MSDWQPIKTAPKDGTRILMFDGDEVVLGHWDYVPQHGEGWRECAGGWCVETPVHWMPLPEPPK